MNLFLDTETSGLPEKFMNWETHYKQFPDVVTIAWRLGNKPAKYFIIHQEGRKLKPEVVKIHGITSKMANDPELTQPASFVFKELLMDAHKALNIIGHNTYFDVSMIKAGVLKVFGPGSEEARVSNDVLHKDKRIDTMRSTQKYFKKWPTLTELHTFLFKEGFAAHSAAEDIAATERCFNELMKRKMI